MVIGISAVAIVVIVFFGHLFNFVIVFILFAIFQVGGIVCFAMIGAVFRVAVSCLTLADIYILPWPTRLCQVALQTLTAADLTSAMHN